MYPCISHTSVSSVFLFSEIVRVTVNSQQIHMSRNSLKFLSIFLFQKQISKIFIYNFFSTFFSKVFFSFCNNENIRIYWKINSVINFHFKYSRVAQQTSRCFRIISRHTGKLWFPSHWISRVKIVYYYGRHIKNIKFFHTKLLSVYNKFDFTFQNKDIDFFQ